MDIKKILEISTWWDSISAKFTSDDQKALLASFDSQVNAANIFSFIVKGEKENALSIFRKLRPENKYSDKLVPRMFEFFTLHKMHEEAYEYIENAIAYIESKGSKVSSEFTKMMIAAENAGLLTKIRKNFGHIPNFDPERIPHLFPVDINGQYELGMFILGELVMAGGVMTTKINAVETIVDENRYTDVLLVALRLRFAIWAWDITDQDRKKNSPRGKSSGEVDLTFRHKGVDFILGEAFVFRKGNPAYSKFHIEKAFHYDSNMKLFYSLVYFTGQQNDFSNCWLQYIDHVKTTTLQPIVDFDPAGNFTELFDWQKKFTNIKTAITRHAGGKVMFHVMYDLSKGPVILKGSAGKKTSAKKAVKKKPIAKKPVKVKKKKK